jgi:hypothetical protein
VLAFVLGLVLLAGLGAVAAIALPDLSRSIETAAPDGAAVVPSGGVTVPSLVGLPLDVAEQRLDELGLRPSEEGTGIFGVLFPSDWDVCATSPAAGTTVTPGSTVRLQVDRPDVC